MKKLSEIAWNKTKPVLHSIKNHPFNTKLAKGNLAMDTFAYYVEQDILYLQNFAKSLAMITARVPTQFVEDFLAFSNFCVVEQKTVHDFFQKTFNLKKTGKLSPATLFYTSYLLQNCSTASVDVAIGSILPCMWVYREVGLSIAKDAALKNPYSQWIETYSNEEFGQQVKKAIDIFDTIAEQASKNIRNQMVDAFYKGTVLEWYFWDDAYHNKVFGDFS